MSWLMRPYLISKALKRLTYVGIVVLIFLVTVEFIYFLTHWLYYDRAWLIYAEWFMGLLYFTIGLGLVLVVGLLLGTTPIEEAT